MKISNLKTVEHKVHVLKDLKELIQHTKRVRDQEDIIGREYWEYERLRPEIISWIPPQRLAAFVLPWLLETKQNLIDELIALGVELDDNT